MAATEAVFPQIETARLRLRELVADDVDTLFAIHGDAETMRWFGADPLRSRAQAAQLVELFASWRTQTNPGVRWGIERKADGALIGTCGLFKWNAAWRSCSLGYELARDMHGAGYMAEALRGALDWGFEHMALNRVEAMIHPNNAASARVVTKLGFLQEGRLREAGFWNGRHHDLDFFALLRSDWVARSGGALEQGS
ncbi:GNAT family N-acetyltransferase [Niveibacterium sp. 24ML]|uniref:GNAT family N-acetyltransferase n=1 Tax=Niveibacterium sp. 24ML TaxID=2985512 RepID=UPI002270C796|nr:GNAT family protein [Niveibacterium sp. 24ML]MCX9156357.1 GNAT family N-acetyltransferase [Niveibacterium sp. 24ML]